MGTKALQSCPTLRDPVDCGPPGSAVYGILQVKILEDCQKGIFPTQGWTLRLLSLLHWQVGSLPLVPPGDTGHSVLKPGPSEQTKTVCHPAPSVLDFLEIKITISSVKFSSVTQSCPTIFRSVQLLSRVRLFATP